MGNPLSLSTFGLEIPNSQIFHRDFKSILLKTNYYQYDIQLTYFN